MTPRIVQVKNLTEKVEKLTPQQRALFDLLLDETRRRQTEIIPVREKAKYYPLTSTQERLWFLDILNGGNPAYHVHYAARLKGALNIKALEYSFGEVVKRHESLRTVFITISGRPYQLIQDNAKFSIPVIDLTHLPKVNQQVETRHLTDEEVYSPFDLSAGPLLRTKILCVDELEYVFLLTLHHIICDGWSISVLIREINELYDCFIHRREPTLSELRIQYTDYALWQHEWLQGENSEKQLSFWKLYLNGASQELALPQDRPRPEAQSYRGDGIALHFSQSLLKSLQAMCRQEEVTLFMLLLAAFMTLLARHSRQSDIVVGVSFANRNLPQIENIIGFFVNTLPLRSDLSANPTFQELLKQIKQNTMEVYERQNVPIVKLINQLQVQRSLNRNPLFQVGMVLQNISRAQLSLSNVSVISVECVNKTAKLDLNLYLEEENDLLRGAFEFSVDLFNNTTIERMACHFEKLLDSIIANPKQRISRLSMMTDSEERELIFTWNNTRVDYSKEWCVRHIFESRAERSPEAIALVFEDQQLTYAQLDRRANQAAHYLRSLGVGPEARVGISMDRGLDMVVAVISVLKAGGAYVPLDPAWPPQRLSFMLEDAQVQLLLTQKRLLGEVPVQGAQAVCLDTDWEKISQWHSDRLLVEEMPDSLAYLIYPPSSTSRPKGIQVRQGGLANVLQSMRHRLGMDQSDTLLAITAVSSGITELELFLPLTVGARLVVASREESSDGVRLWKRMREEGVTVLQATPSTWRLLTEAGWRVEGRMRALCGGEALSRQLAMDLRSRGAELWNLYGQTETTIWSSLQLVEDDVYLGEPVANTCFYVFEEEGQLAVLGVAGELYIGGEGLARGYSGRPDLTAERFVPDGYSKRVGARLYRTRDMVRRRADGSLEYVGRGDQQVELCGYGNKNAGEFTPFDFPLAKLSQPELDRLLQSLKLIGIEDS